MHLFFVSTHSCTSTMSEQKSESTEPTLTDEEMKVLQKVITIAEMMPFSEKMRQQHVFNQFNKFTKKPKRWCAACDKRFELQGDEENSDDLVKWENHTATNIP